MMRNDPLHPMAMVWVRVILLSDVAVIHWMRQGDVEATHQELDGWEAKQYQASHFKAVDAVDWMFDKCWWSMLFILLCVSHCKLTNDWKPISRLDSFALANALSQTTTSIGLLGFGSASDHRFSLISTPMLPSFHISPLGRFARSEIHKNIVCKWCRIRIQTTSRCWRQIFWNLHCTSVKRKSE